MKLNSLTFNPVAAVRMVISLYMIFGMSEIATIIGAMFLLQDIDLEIEFEV